MNRNRLRYIEPGHDKDSLTDHEINELESDFDMNLSGCHVLVALTKEEWEYLIRRQLICK